MGVPRPPSSGASGWAHQGAFAAPLSGDLRCGHSDLFAPGTRPRTLGARNPSALEHSVFYFPRKGTTPVGWIPDTFCKFSASHYRTPGCSFSWSWRAAILTEPRSRCQQRQGKQRPLHRTLPSHTLRDHKGHMLERKPNVPSFRGCSAEKHNTRTPAGVAPVFRARSGRSGRPPQHLSSFSSGASGNL